MKLNALLRERLGSGLKRKAIVKCSQWAERYRVMGAPFSGNWSFRFFPWLREMHDSDAEENIGMKAAQVGYTETMLNRAFFYMDIKGLNVLYLLPAADPDASDFSARAFDPALEMSPHLNAMFNDVRNVGHKRAGSANLFVRGTKSRTGLKSIPAALLIFDELEEMVQQNLFLAEERTGGQLEWQKWKISTPKIEDAGIHALFKASTQEHFLFRCHSCSKLIEFKFPESLVITATSLLDLDGIRKSHYQCTECKAVLTHEEKEFYLKDGIWVPNNKSERRGFSINRMYSSAKSGMAPKFAEMYLKSLEDPWAEQELFNSWIGIAHVVKGGQINDQDLQNMLKGHRTGEYNPDRLIVMGVDVGTYFHFEVCEYAIHDGPTYDINTNARARVIESSKVRNPEDLDLLMQRYPIRMCVIDANPEKRTALNFANRHPGRVKLCYYGRGVNGKTIKESEDDNEPTITVDRTAWLDISLGRVKKGTVDYPLDTTLETKAHLKALVRIFEKDVDGNPIARWVNGNKDDHAAHARNYAEIALPLAYSQATSQNISEVL
jgi:hypothetical protein